jgi:Glucosidase II beta subunit-like protein
MTSLQSARPTVPMRCKLNLSYLFIIGLFIFSFIERHHGLSEEIDPKNIDLLSPLKNKCFDTSHIPSWWSYVWCFRDDIRQMHVDESQNVVQSYHFIGKFVPSESQSLRQVYRHNISDCQSISGLSLLRYADVVISCCRDENWSSMHERFESMAGLGTFIESVTEASECEYHLKVCSDLVCPKLTYKAGSARGAVGNHLTSRSNGLKHDSIAFGFSSFLKDQIHRARNIPSDVFVSEADQSSKLVRVRKMFQHGYDMYMEHARPEVTLITPKAVCKIEFF